MDFHVQSNPEASFKTYFLDKEDRVREIRRFVLPYPLHVAHLVEKIRTLYDINRSQEVRLQWLDPECDQVTFTTDEELGEAIRVVTNAHRNINSDRTLRVYVSLSQDSISGQSVIHPTVVCDGCEQRPLRGYRFKCAICPDYDLCCECVVKNQHSEHPMILLRRPRDPVMFRLSKWLHRSYWARKCRGAENAGAGSGSNAESVAGVGDCLGASGGGGGLPDDCMRILRELEAAAMKVVQHQQQQQLQQQLCGFSEASMEELQRSEQLPPICVSDSGGTSSSSQEMLHFVHGISTHLNALLQPLGIEVSYHASAQQQQQQPQSPKPPCVARQQQQQQQQLPKPEPNRQQQVPEHSGDFVMVGDESAAASAAATAAAVAASAAEAAAARRPPLPSHVATALEQMQAMGFTDEGGLLTELLVSANGNIDRVLDALRQN